MEELAKSIKIYHAKSITPQEALTMVARAMVGEKFRANVWDAFEVRFKDSQSTTHSPHAPSYIVSVSRTRQQSIMGEHGPFIVRRLNTDGEML